MTDYTVKVTKHAEESMKSIGMYIAFELLNPKAAFDLLDLFQEEIESLRKMPERVALTHEEPWRSYGIRQLIVKNFYIYFWIDEEGKKVQVTDTGCDRPAAVPHSVGNDGGGMVRTFFVKGREDE